MKIVRSNEVDPKPDHDTLALKRYFGSKQVAAIDVEDIDPDLEPEHILVKDSSIPPAEFFRDCYQTLASNQHVKIHEDTGVVAREDTVVSVSCDSVDLNGYPTELFRRNGLQCRFRFNLSVADPTQPPNTIDHCTKNLLSDALNSDGDEAIRQEKRLYTKDVQNGFLEFLAANPDLPDEIKALTTDQMAIVAIVLCNRASYAFWDESLYDETGLIVEYETSSDACLNVSPLMLSQAVGYRYNFEAEAARIIGDIRNMPMTEFGRKRIIERSIMNVRHALSDIKTGTFASQSKIEHANADVAKDAHRKNLVTVPYSANTETLLSGIQAALYINQRPNWITLDTSRQILANIAKDMPPSHMLLPDNLSDLEAQEPLDRFCPLQEDDAFTMTA